MGSPQTLSEADRRTVALWAADCAERVLPLFEAEAPIDGRPADAIARARAFGRGELDAAGQIRQRFVAGRAAGAVAGPGAISAARPAAQAAGVAHLGAHALDGLSLAFEAGELVGGVLELADGAGDVAEAVGGLVEGVGDFLSIFDI